MKDILVFIKDKVSEISRKSHFTGYDFNADIAGITLMEGEIFSAIEKAIASQPGVEAVGIKRCHICMNLGYTERFCYYCGREANPPAARKSPDAEASPGSAICDF